MQQVSTNITRVTVEAVGEVTGVAVAELMKDSPLPNLFHEEFPAWITWESYAGLIQWLDHSKWGPIDWPLVGATGFRPAKTPLAAKACILALSVRNAYWICGKWFGPSQFRVVNCTITNVGPNQIIETLEIPESLRPCPQAFHLFKGNLMGMPSTMFGLPPSQVEARIEGRKGVYIVTMPEKKLFWRKALRFAASLFGINKLFRELALQQQVVSEKTLQNLRERSELKQLIDHLPDGLIIHRDGIVLFMNQKMLSFLNCPDLSSVLGKNVYDLIVPEQRKMVLDRVAQFRRTPAHVNPPLEVAMSKFGSDEYFYGESTSMTFSYEGAPAVAVVTRDLSDRKKFQSRMIEADRLTSLGQLAAGVGHEINNPLCYVMLKIEQLQAELSANLNDKAKADLEAVQSGLNRISSIVKDLKAFSRTNTEETCSDVDVGDVLHTAVSMVKHIIEQRAQLKISLSQTEPIYANEGRLVQVFINLLTNAAFAIEPGKADQNFIEVSAFQRWGQVEITVRDSGAGIPESVQKNIFKPFFTTKPVGEGTGLGLSICKSIVSQFDGEICFESKVGKGTCFTVVLPVSKRSTKHEVASSVKDSPDKIRGRVLVIDDDPILLETLAEIVAQWHDTTAVEDARKGLGLIEKGENFDVILCDLMMPNMGGIEFYEKLSVLSPKQCEKIVFLTGGSFANTTDQFLKKPGIKSCNKPIANDQLLQLLQDSVRENREKPI